MTLTCSCLVSVVDKNSVGSALYKHTMIDIVDLLAVMFCMRLYVCVLKVCVFCNFLSLSLSVCVCVCVCVYVLCRFRPIPEDLLLQAFEVMDCIGSVCRVCRLSWINSLYCRLYRLSWINSLYCRLYRIIPWVPSMIFIFAKREKHLKYLLQVLDKQKKGHLELEELTKYMTQEGEPFTQEEMEEMLSAAMDPDKNLIFYKDFVSMMTVDDPR
uniref:EF-hand calcium binding domain 2 n=1 Tax=Salmo trutta TaxID=8032 RepID=A0A674EQJ2_SALTR